MKWIFFHRNPLEEALSLSSRSRRKGWEKKFWGKTCPTTCLAISFSQWNLSHLKVCNFREWFSGSNICHLSPKTWIQIPRTTESAGKLVHICGYNAPIVSLGTERRKPPATPRLARFAEATVAREILSPTRWRAKTGKPKVVLWPPYLDHNTCVLMHTSHAHTSRSSTHKHTPAHSYTHVHKNDVFNFHRLWVIHVFYNP